MYRNPHAREWDRVMAVNVRSHFLACKHALPVMTAGGSIVLISSTAARLPPGSRRYRHRG
jgi:NAD(P)-dependent dehydrogenase (short-subunit alcohol dehydrogenase family)